jgi:hypothetical protein
MQILKQDYCNDTEPDCAIASVYHILGVESANAGDPFTATKAQINKDFVAVSGDPTLQSGCDMQTCLQYYCSTGFANGSKALGWLSISANNAPLLKQAIWLFENLDFGLSLPDAWVNPTMIKDGFTWDVAGNPDPNNGHSFMGAAYDDTSIKVASWGLLGSITLNAVARYGALNAGGEIYVLLLPDQVAKGQTKAPNGIAWADLISDWNSLGGHAPPPVDPPAPAPSPAPPVAPTGQGVTLAMAQAATDSAFAHQTLLWGSSAGKIARSALAKIPGWPSG